jgi:hypothetical protein
MVEKVEKVEKEVDREGRSRSLGFEGRWFVWYSWALSREEGWRRRL